LKNKPKTVYKTPAETARF